MEVESLAATWKIDELKDIAKVKKYMDKQDNDEYEYRVDDDDQHLSFDEDLSSVGMFDIGDESSSSTKRKLQSTLAGATIGKEQLRRDKTKDSVLTRSRRTSNISMQLTVARFNTIVR